MQMLEHVFLFWTVSCWWIAKASAFLGLFQLLFDWRFCLRTLWVQEEDLRELMGWVVRPVLSHAHAQVALCPKNGDKALVMEFEWGRGWFACGSSLLVSWILEGQTCLRRHHVPRIFGTLLNFAVISSTGDSQLGDPSWAESRSSPRYWSWSTCRSWWVPQASHHAWREVITVPSFHCFSWLCSSVLNCPM